MKLIRFLSVTAVLILSLTVMKNLIAFIKKKKKSRMAKVIA
jgi:hypothetical protein